MTVPMTKTLLEELADLVALGEKATPGPWIADGSVVNTRLGTICQGVTWLPNAPLIAALRNFLSRSDELRRALENDARYRWLFYHARPASDGWHIKVPCEFPTGLGVAIDAARKDRSDD